MKRWQQNPPVLITEINTSPCSDQRCRGKRTSLLPPVITGTIWIVHLPQDVWASCVSAPFSCVCLCLCVFAFLFFDTYNINSNLGFWWDHWLVKTCHTVIDEVLVVSRVRSPQWKQTNENNCTNLAGFFANVLLPPGNMAPIKRWRKHTIQ